jgi:hypothetical protein
VANSDGAQPRDGAGGGRDASRRLARRCAAARALAATWALATLALLAAPASAAAQPTPAPPRVLDGPSAAIPTPTGLGSAVARDGTGGIVYLKQVAGVPHVFLAPLVGGVLDAPLQLDGSLPGPSSQPVLAASNGGALVVAFINGGALYAITRPSATSALSRPRWLAGGASNPALRMSQFGKAYVAFTAAVSGGFDVRAAYFNAGRWALESAPLNSRPGDDAGTGAGRPAVAVAGDGVALVAWGESGHIYVRRVWAATSSVALARADGSLPGCAELSADEPAVGTGGDSSYAAVAFHERLSCGGAIESRVVENRLQASAFDGEVPADALGSPPSDGADDPAVVVAEYGSGWVTSSHTGSENGYALALGTGEVAAAHVDQLGSLAGTTAPDVTPAMAGYYSSAIAWQRDPGTAGPAEIRMRYGDPSGALSPELVLSSPSDGPTDAANGLTDAGNVAGEVLVAWAQRTASGEEIVTDQLYTPPSAPAPLDPPRYMRTTRPHLAWAPSGELWGPVTYTVALDGHELAQTRATAVDVASPLTQGRHTWQISATNAVGLASGPRTAALFVDTIAPQIMAFTLTGSRRAGAALRVHVVASDARNTVPAAEASGVKSILVRWGDRSSEVIRAWRDHVYAKPGRYRITIVVTDRAGNVTRSVMTIRVKPKPKAKSKPESKPTPTGSGGSPIHRPRHAATIPG